jgi:hypothetical protein
MSDANPDDITSNAGTGLANGLLSLIGLGSLYDPLSDLQGELSDAHQNLTNIINTGTTLSLKAQVGLDNTLITYIKTNNAELTETMNLYNQQSKNTDQTQNFFISFSILLIFIVIFFMLIKKK